MDFALDVGVGGIIAAPRSQAHWRTARIDNRASPLQCDMPTPLTARERAHLKARAHALEPVVQAGSAGVTDRLVAEVDRALTAHELIKVKVNTDDRADRVAVGEEICARTGATAVHRVGKVVILWRPRPAESSG
jgi:RNA-binding protein